MANWLSRLLRPEFRYRSEAFGGIVMTEQPPLLLTLDREGMRSMGIASSELWEAPDPGPPFRRFDGPRLSAPVEAHIALTNRCTAGCDHCYMDSVDEVDGELGFEGMKRVVDELADMGVFHVALGGGESFLLPWLYEIAEYARERGIVPNVTTSGLGMTEAKAERSTVFGRINVSIDEFRTPAQQKQALHSIRLLRSHHAQVGINCVVTRQNADDLEARVRMARDEGLDEVEFLRLKPAGRGRLLYLANRTTPAQNERLIPTLLKLRRRYGVQIKVDCSFAPMVAHTGIDPEQLSVLSVLGCEGGDYLIGVDATGQAHPCSFEHEEAVDALSLSERWDEASTFPSYRGYGPNRPEPCASCTYATVCRGGCRVVARFLTGDPAAPDPECPRVLALETPKLASKPTDPLR